MQLNLPIFEQLQDAQSILIAGAGGGFDVYAGLPLYFTLREMGKTVHLANYSFMPIQLASKLSPESIRHTEHLLQVQGKMKVTVPYNPEGCLAEWLCQTFDEMIPVWLLEKTGVQPLRKSYEFLIDHFNIDALILVDGGVDSLMRGDETAPGTLLEDTITLAAVAPLPIPVKILGCIGFGTEVEESVNHHHALENMATLIKKGAFMGSCALTPQMPVFESYAAACRYAWERRDDSHQSHISTRIIPAVQGEFGNYHMYPHSEKHKILVSILMGLYWFFEATAVAEASHITPVIEDTDSTDECFGLLRMHREQLNQQKKLRLPRRLTY